MPSMAFDSGFPSLPFAPLPHLCEKISCGRPPKLFLLDSDGGPAEDKPKERLICRGGLSEELKSSTILEAAPGNDSDNPLSWAKLASRLVPVTAQGEASARLMRGFTIDITDEQQWSPLCHLLSSDEVTGDRLLGNIHGFNASAAAVQSIPPFTIDITDEQQWSPLCHLLSSDEVTGDGLLGNIHGFSASAAAVQSTPPSKQKPEDPEKQDFHVNIGYAIRTLREELPSMFYTELTYDIYRKDIVFRDPMNMVGGIDNYKLIFRALRFHGRVFFKALWVDILRIWQPSDNVIMVRWQVRGIPRVPWEAQGIFDGTSEYKLDKHGKIYEHKVDNVALNARPKFKVPTVAELLRVGTCPSTPKPTFFQKAEEVFTVLIPYLLQFSWVRYYLALKGTVGLYQDPHML